MEAALLALIGLRLFLISTVNGLVWGLISTSKDVGGNARQTTSESMILCSHAPRSFPYMNAGMSYAQIGPVPKCGGTATGGSGEKEGDIRANKGRSGRSIPVDRNGGSPGWHPGRADHQPGQPE